jgi:hypothetical protein
MPTLINFENGQSFVLGEGKVAVYTLGDEFPFAILSFSSHGVAASLPVDLVVHSVTVPPNTRDVFFNGSRISGSEQIIDKPVRVTRGSMPQNGRG